MILVDFRKLSPRVDLLMHTGIISVPCESKNIHTVTVTSAFPSHPNPHLTHPTQPHAMTILNIDWQGQQIKDIKFDIRYWYPSTFLHITLSEYNKLILFLESIVDSNICRMLFPGNTWTLYVVSDTWWPFQYQIWGERERWCKEYLWYYQDRACPSITWMSQLWPYPQHIQMQIPTQNFSAVKFFS